MLKQKFCHTKPYKSTNYTVISTEKKTCNNQNDKYRERKKTIACGVSIVKQLQSKTITKAITITTTTTVIIKKLFSIYAYTLALCV